MEAHPIDRHNMNQVLCDGCQRNMRNDLRKCDDVKDCGLFVAQIARSKAIFQIGIYEVDILDRTMLSYHQIPLGCD